MVDMLWRVHLLLMIVSVFALIFVLILLDELKKRTIIITVIISIAIILLFFYGNCKCKNAEWTEDHYSTERIVALNDNNLTYGRIYARRGYINEDLYYQYMVKLNSGGYVANKVNSKHTTLYYTDHYYRVEWWERTRGWLYFRETERYNKIYLPEGSITDDYSIDLQ